MRGQVRADRDPVAQPGNNIRLVLGDQRARAGLDRERRAQPEGVGGDVRRRRARLRGWRRTERHISCLRGGGEHERATADGDHGAEDRHSVLEKTHGYVCEGLRPRALLRNSSALPPSFGRSNVLTKCLVYTANSLPYRTVSPSGVVTRNADRVVSKRSNVDSRHLCEQRRSGKLGAGRGDGALAE